MHRYLLCSAVACSVVLLGLHAASSKDETWFSPGKRSTLLAHNAFPDGRKWTDRLDRALAAGSPSMIEIDLIWRKDAKTGQFRSFVSRPESFSGEEPDFGHYFFPKVRPIVEKALKDGNRGNWPLIVLFLDTKDNAPEHVQEIWKQVGQYEGWLTTAVKTSEAAKLSPLDVKPLMVVVNDKADSAQEEYFYKRLPAGGKLRIFGAAKTYTPARGGQKGQSPSVAVSEIASNANARRFRTKANGPWSARQVVATLRNPVYAGRFKDGKGVRPACHHSNRIGVAQSLAETTLGKASKMKPAQS